VAVHERPDVPALNISYFRDIPVSTTFSPVVPARRGLLVFSRVAFLMFAHDHGSFELIWNLSVPGSSRTVSQSDLFEPAEFRPARSMAIWTKAKVKSEAEGEGERRRMR
jgi:hypothetical protein